MQFINNQHISIFRFYLWKLYKILRRLEALREPIGHIHWTGTETAKIWNGYIDGAIRSGERVVEEILRSK